MLADYEARFDNTAITCLRGVSGRGKTTLLRLVAGLERPDGGRVEVRPPGTLACSFQDDRLLPWLTAEANIALAIVPRCRDRQHAADLCAYLLARMGLEEMGDKYPAQLSGGQRQQVNLARALAARADILLLDEPLTGLDEATKRRTLDLILDWTRAYRPPRAVGHARGHPPHPSGGAVRAWRLTYLPTAAISAAASTNQAQASASSCHSPICAARSPKACCAFFHSFLSR